MDEKTFSSPLSTRRVNVLAFPAPTTGLYLLFIAALLAVGLFVGSWMHNIVLGKEWIQALNSCFALNANEQRACTATVESRRGLWSFGGTVIMTALSAAVLYAVPPIIRHRRALKLPMLKHQGVVERFALLATQARLQRTPKLYIGPARMGDAFSFGRPGAPAVALPPKIVGLLVRPGPADGVLLHEFAHIRHRDVELAWIARSAWYVALLVLIFPVVGAFWEGPSLLPNYLWRAAVLAVVVEIVTASLLRAREHDADLRATYAPASFMTVRSGLKLLGTDNPRNWLQRLRRRHPTRTERLDFLESPHLVARSSLPQALSAGILAGVLGPLLVSAATPLLSGTDIVLGGIWTSAVVAGSLLGLTVGLDIWRSKFSGSLAHGTVEPGSQTIRGVSITAVGVSVGLALGQIVSLGGIGQAVSAPLAPMTLIVPVLVGLGTVYISAAFAAVCLPLALLAIRPWHFWLSAVLLNIAIFLVSTWIASSLNIAWTGFGWLGAILWAQYGFDEWPGICVAMLLTVVAFLTAILGPKSSRRAAQDWMYFPSQLSEITCLSPLLSATGSRLRFPLLLGIATGMVGAFFLVYQILLISPIATAEAAAQANSIWTSTTVICWAVSAAILCLINPTTGPAQGFIAGPLSLAFCELGLAIFWFASKDTAPIGDLLSFWFPAMARGLLVSIMIVGLVVPIRYSISVAARRRYRN